jgi:hypothetical protein
MNWNRIAKWFGPAGLTVLGLLLFSLAVVGIRCLRNRALYESFQDQQERQYPTPNMEKVRDILPYLQSYLLDTHPYRSWMVAVDGDERTDERKKRHHKPYMWEDLSNNKHDWGWNGGPRFVPQTGFPTSSRTLHGVASRNFGLWQTGEFTIILRAQSSASDDNQKAQGPPTTEEVVQNAILCAAKQHSEMWLKFPAHTQDLCEKINKCLNSTEQTSGNCQDIMTMVQQLQKEAVRQPKRPPAAISFSGNEKDALTVHLPQTYGPIEVEVAGKHYQTKKKVNAKLDTYYSFTYRGSHLRVYTDGDHLHTFSDIPRPYFNNGEALINPSGKWDTTLMEVAVLNRYLHPDQLALFRHKGLVLRAILQEHQDGKRVPGLLPPVGCTSCSGFCKCPNGEIFDPFQPHKKPPNNGEGCECVVACDCPDNPNPFGPDPDYDPNCPPVQRDANGYYWVDGTNYGNQRSRAREIYQINYPNCQNLPDELRYDYDRRSASWGNCPFVVRSELNPCLYPSCDRADWQAPDPADANLSGRCRRRINAYCEEHPYLDDFCSCWRKEYWDLPKCRRFRRKFQHPGERGCRVTDFEIEDHPDMDNYIRKDRIPCWNCDVEQASGDETCPVSYPQQQDSGIQFKANVSVSGALDGDGGCPAG